MLERLISKWAGTVSGEGNKKWSPRMTSMFLEQLLFYECPFYLVNRSQRAVEMHCHQEVKLEWRRGNNYS